MGGEKTDMWFECSQCGMILPLYLMDPDSARYVPFGDWFCWYCGSLNDKYTDADWEY